MAPTGQRETPSYQARREELLPDQVRSSLWGQFHGNLAGVVSMVGTGVLAGVAAQDFATDPTFARPTTLVLGGLTLAAGTSIVAGEDARDLVLPLMSPVAVGALSLIGLLHGVQLFERTYVGVAYAGATFGTAALLGVNLVSQYGTMSRLRPADDRMAEAVLPPDELRGVERDFLASAVPIPRWLVITPLASSSD